MRLPKRLGQYLCDELSASLRRQGRDFFVQLLVAPPVFAGPPLIVQLVEELLNGLVETEPLYQADEAALRLYLIHVPKGGK